ncbi:MFS transporter [Paludibacterium sp. B53371]|uniref:MFS transporter n=1 Tax=Paludibacterium sp. B53371 TaxID=2806263 RepID=UPI00207B7500|nr:MFS transporter [Paludibacterium sp. B53371]
MALTPVLAPMLGGLIETHAGWRADFLLMALLGAVLLWLIWRHVPETVTLQTRQQARTPLARQYALLLRDRDFLRPTLTISLGYATYFAFISASSFLFQHDLQLSPLQYAGCFALSVLGYLLGAHLMRRLAGRLALDRLLGGACLLNLLASLLLWLSVRIWPASPWAIVLPMMLLMLSVGVLIPACQLAVMQAHPQRVGTASGLFFFVQMSCAALCSTLIGCLPGGAAVMAGVILSASLLTSLAWFALAPRGVRPRVTA